MGITEVWTVNTKLAPRRWSRPVAITLSDTNSERNLQQNGKYPYRYIQNIGTAGLVYITYEPDNSTPVPLYLNQGQVHEGGHWCHARTADTTIGVSLIGFIGIEGVDS